MDLAITRAQKDAVLGAKHLPDVTAAQPLPQINGNKKTTAPLCS